METFGPLRVHIAESELSSEKRDDWSAVILEEKDSSKIPNESVNCQWRDSNNKIWLSIFDRGEIVRCFFADGYQFQIDFSQRKIFLLNRLEWDEISLRHLRNHILPIIMQSSGELVLHASAVTLNLPDKPAVLFVGRSGVGKSTLAAFLSERHPLLADDASLLFTDGASPRVVATSSSVALWPRSEALLNLKPLSDVSRIADKKRELEVRVDGKTSALRGVYFLRQESERLQVTEICGGELLRDLQSAVLTMRPHDTQLNGAMFAKLSSIAQSVPCYELQYPPGLSGLEKVEQRLLETLV